MRRQLRLASRPSVLVQYQQVGRFASGPLVQRYLSGVLTDLGGYRSPGPLYRMMVDRVPAELKRRWRVSHT